MKYSNKLAATTTAALIVLGVAGGALAAKAVEQSDKEKTEIAALLSAKLSITDAAKVAETETGGKAVEVSIEDENGTVLYEVETLKADGTETKVMINAMDGKIVRVASANDGNEDESDDNHNENNDENDEDGTDN